MGIAPEDRDRIEDSLRGRPEDATRPKLLGQFKSLGHMPTSSETGSREFALAPIVATFEEREGAPVGFVFESDPGTVYAFNAIPLQAQAPPAAGELAILHPVDPDRWAFRRGHQCNAKLTITVVKKSYQADNGAADGSRFRITMYKRASDGSDTGSAVIDTHTTDYTGRGDVCTTPNTTPWNAAQVPYAAPIGQLVVDVPDPGSYNLKVWDASGDTSKVYSAVKTFTGCLNVNYCIFFLTSTHIVHVFDALRGTCAHAGSTLRTPLPIAGATVEMWNYPLSYTPPPGFPPTTLIDTQTSDAAGVATFHITVMNEFNFPAGGALHYIITASGYKLSPTYADNVDTIIGYTPVSLCQDDDYHPASVGGFPGQYGCAPPQIHISLYDSATDQFGNNMVNLDYFWGDMAGKSYTLSWSNTIPPNPVIGYQGGSGYASPCQNNVQVFPPPTGPVPSAHVEFGYGSISLGGIVIFQEADCKGVSNSAIQFTASIDPCTTTGGPPPQSGKLYWTRYSTYQQIYEVGTWSF